MEADKQMEIHFWGVRGSLPAPLHPWEIKEKISAILKEALPEDLATPESRRRFLDGLPPWLYGTVGGNSPCVSVTIDGFDEPIIFDCGSGLREMGLAYLHKDTMPHKYHIFFSHFHWDHLLGFPFFNPAYNPAVTLDFYSPRLELEDVLVGQMCSPYFPVRLENMPAHKNFHYLREPVSIGPATISFRGLYHPGGSFAYMISHNGKRFIYATDTELGTADFEQNEENANFFKDADVIVLDSQYTLGEAIEKYNWGHTAFSLSVDFAANWGIKHLVLFHHDPAYDDQKLYGILQSARGYIERMGIHGMKVSLATEELKITL